MPHEIDKRVMLERKRNILMLVSQYLIDHGLNQTAEQLAVESGHLASAQTEYQLCDNVDLDSIYLDYMSYNKAKFGREPRITKRMETAADPGAAGDATGANSTKGVRRQKSCTGALLTSRRRSDMLRTNSNNVPNGSASKEKSASKSSLNLSASLVVSSLSDLCIGGVQAEHYERPLLRHHPNSSQPEWIALAEAICRDIVDGSTLPATLWPELRGLDVAKEILHESVLTPLQYPALFAGELRPWRCILLHGPPGTGKTSLARALCSEAAGRAIFFNVSASAMVSKWRGDSEKLVRVLFDVAKYMAPSIIFIDEVDGLMSRRDGSADQHEASKRFKNELLTNIDGLEQRGAAEQNVFVLGSTNLPWDLDPAFLRRFERKLLLGLPGAAERLQILGDLMPRAAKWPAEVRERFASLTTAFSGDDVRIVHKTAAMQSVRQTIRQLRTAHKPSGAMRPPEISADVLLDACGKHRPMAHTQIGKYELWQQRNGGGGGGGGGGQ